MSGDLAKPASTAALRSPSGSTPMTSPYGGSPASRLRRYRRPRMVATIPGAATDCPSGQHAGRSSPDCRCDLLARAHQTGRFEAYPIRYTGDNAAIRPETRGPLGSIWTLTCDDRNVGASKPGHELVKMSTSYPRSASISAVSHSTETVSRYPYVETMAARWRPISGPGLPRACQREDISCSVGPRAPSLVPLQRRAQPVVESGPSDEPEAPSGSRGVQRSPWLAIGLARVPAIHPRSRSTPR